ncbi:glycoside hydrolase [Imleria badia]|nr:glycoside hydrolase [Imleria badia]
MKYLASLVLALAVAGATPVKRSNPLGIDVSDYQPNINWPAVASNGIKFVYIKATEGTCSVILFAFIVYVLSYIATLRLISPTFNSQYTGATKAGLIRGSYHFARPDTTSGATQANYFLAHGGGWSPDGITLPGVLDIEYNPYGAECYGLTHSGMVSWIKDFSNTYEAKTKRYPVIYTTTDWWTTCTGNSAAFGADNPLWIADYASKLGALPAGCEYTSFWQYADKGPNPGDADLWNGDYAGLQRYVSSSRLEWHNPLAFRSQTGWLVALEALRFGIGDIFPACTSSRPCDERGY